MRPMGEDFHAVLAEHRRTIEDLELKIWLAESHPDGPQGAVIVEAEALKTAALSFAPARWARWGGVPGSSDDRTGAVGCMAGRPKRLRPKSLRRKPGVSAAKRGRAATFLSISPPIASDDKEVVGGQREAWVDEREADRGRA